MYEEHIGRYIENKNIILHHNNESGNIVLVCRVVESKGFWLNSFGIKAEAIDYCSKNGLKVVGIYDDFVA